MALRALLSPTSIFPKFDALSKTDALLRLSRYAARRLGLEPTVIFNALIEREALGSTGFGGGVAIPHGKLAELGAVTGFFARLQKPLDWDALDGAPIESVFMIIAPSGAPAAHLKALARVSRILRDPDTRVSLRATDDADTLYAILTGANLNTAAA